MRKSGTDIWKRLIAAEGKLSAGVKNLQYANGRAINSEDELCAEMVRWWDLIFPERKQDLIHIPNEGSGSRKRGFELKKIGVRAGVPDYLVCFYGQPVGWLEVKFGDNKLQPSQVKFRDVCKQHGVKWAEIRSFAQFKDVLQRWGLYDPDKDKPKFFQEVKAAKPVDINLLFKKVAKNEK